MNTTHRDWPAQVLALVVLLLLVPDRAAAHGMSNADAAMFVLVLLVAPLGALLCLVTLVLGFRVRSRMKPGGRLARVLNVASVVTMGLGVATLLWGVSLGIDARDPGYLLSFATTGLIPIGVGLLARKIGRGANRLTIADDDPALDSET